MLHGAHCGGAGAAGVASAGSQEERPGCSSVCIGGRRRRAGEGRHFTDPTYVHFTDRPTDKERKSRVPEAAGQRWR